MNVGVLITHFDRIGGAELQARYMSAALAKRGHAVTVFTRRDKGFPKFEQCDGFVIKRRAVIGIPGLRMFADVVPLLAAIKRNQQQIDVLLCYQTLSSGFFGDCAQAVLGIPAIVSIRGNAEYRFLDSFRSRVFAPGIIRRAQRVLIQTPRIAKDMEKQFQKAGMPDAYASLSKRVRVVPNGVNLPTPNTSTGRKIVFVGRLIPDKGVSDLITACVQLPDIEVEIIGDGPERERLEALAGDAPIKFVGAVEHEHVIERLRDARVLVLPSHAGDGLPNVILEAMSVGVPVISTHVAGIPDVVQDGVTGLLFPRGDILQLVTHLKTLFRDDHLYAEYSAKAIVAAQGYSWDVVSSKMEEQLASVVKVATSGAHDQTDS
jgi:glycosyltransferase involved in cell wall biosynthesis